MAKPEKKIMIVDGRVFRVKKKWNELSRDQKRWILADAKFYYDKMTQLSHKQMTAGLNHCGENQEEKRRVDNQAGTQFAESNLLKIGRKSV